MSPTPQLVKVSALCHLLVKHTTVHQLTVINGATNLHGTTQQHNTAVQYVSNGTVCPVIKLSKLQRLAALVPPMQPMCHHTLHTTLIFPCNHTHALHTYPPLYPRRTLPCDSHSFVPPPSLAYHTRLSLHTTPTSPHTLHTTLMSRRSSRLGCCGSITRSTASTAMGDIRDVCWLMTLLLRDLQRQHTNTHRQTGRQADRQRWIEHKHATGEGGPTLGTVTPVAALHGVLTL